MSNRAKRRAQKQLDYELKEVALGELHLEPHWCLFLGHVLLVYRNQLSRHMRSYRNLKDVWVELPMDELNAMVDLFGRINDRLRSLDREGKIPTAPTQLVEVGNGNSV